MTGLLVVGSARTAGVTFYTKKGKTIVRTSHSMQPKRRTRAQFDVRMRLKHTISLWQMMKMSGATMFHGGASAYACFASLAYRLPVVYIPRSEPINGASLLLPEMPVSDGTLPKVRQWLGEVDGHAALLTGLRRDDVKPFDSLLLYTLKQDTANTPQVRIGKREVALEEMVEVDGNLALVDDGFADTMKGWALVHVSGDRCSSQTVVTRCTYYRQFTTEEAMQTALDSYGGLKEK